MTRKECPGCRLDRINEIKTGVPYLNFFYIWIICLSSTLPIQSLFPYLYFMIEDFKIAEKEQDIGFYAGFVGAAFFLGRTVSAVPWGMFADTYGRKPCILISLISVILLNTLFGLSTSYKMAIITRGSLGLLCGILGPIKAYASEVCRKEHRTLGISLVTTARAIAFVVGPTIGGFLSQPAKKYPNVFSEKSIFGRRPYFLPSLVISVLAAGACLACIWLPETLHKHHDVDDSVEDKKKKSESTSETSDKTDAGPALTEIKLESNGASENSDAVEKEKDVNEKRSTSAWSLLKNRHLMSAVAVYCFFSLYDTAYSEIFSLWAVSSRKYRGLGFTSQDVGTVLAISGVGVFLYQFMIFPFLEKHVGLIKQFRSAAVLSVILLPTYPFMANLYGIELKVLISISSLLKNVFAATITTACNILQNTAVSQEQRGVANGISVTLMSIFKAVGPATAGILFSWAQKNITGLFLPGDHILFLLLNVAAAIGLVLTFKPFFSIPSAMK